MASTTAAGEIGPCSKDAMRVERAPLIIADGNQSKEQSHSRIKCKVFLKWLKTNLLLILTIASIIMGIIIGVAVREVKYPQHSEEQRVMVVLLSFPGEIFLRMLKMLILPLIVFSLIAGLGSLEAKVAGSLGWKTILYYMSTTMSAVILGLILVVSIKPGGRNITVRCDNATNPNPIEDIKILDSILDLIRNIFPDNLFTATFETYASHYIHENVTDFNKCLEIYNITLDDYTMATSHWIMDNLSNITSPHTCSNMQSLIEELELSCKNATEERLLVVPGSRQGINILGVIIFAIPFGIILGQLGPEGRRVVQVIGVMNEAIMKLVTIVMWYSPIGIASIVAGKLAEVDSFFHLLEEIGLYFTTVILGLFIHGVIVLPLIYIVMTRSNPLKLVKSVLQALLTAFGTSSSSATLPVTIQNLEDNFGIDPRVTRFMLPVGATINMDGTALYEAVAAVFIAQSQNEGLTFVRILVITITAICASVGAAGVPQAGLFTLVIVVIAAGLNPEGIALILTVDWFLDRFRTTVNVLGDAFGAGIVYHYSKKQLGPLPEKDSSDVPSAAAARLFSNHSDNISQNGSDAESNVESSPLYKSPSRLSQFSKEETDL